jgi:sialate O-acetylesterase
MRLKNLFFLLLLTGACTLQAQISLPRLISDGMVLQRDAEITLWGWAAPNEALSISFIDSTYHTRATAQGDWQLKLSGLKAGGPYAMQLSASNRLTLKNIMVGDVYLCSGQSNMELPLRRVSWVYPEVLARDSFPAIRQFFVPRVYEFNMLPGDLKAGSWNEATRENLPDFSAVAYFFAHEQYKHHQVPIGLINSAWGGSPIEAWLSEDALKEFPRHYEEFQQLKDSTRVARIINDDRQRIDRWHRQLYQDDQGYRNADEPWFAHAVDHSGWDTTPVPGFWDNTPLGDTHGVVWFRKNFIVAESLAGKPALLVLGCMVDTDSVYLNGQLVGTTSYQYPPRRYPIPEGALRPGNNTLTVRIINKSGRGGFVPGKDYRIESSVDTLDLEGIWHYKLGTAMPALEQQTFFNSKPGALYPAMIHPLKPYALKGVLWYQGESNESRPREYAPLLKTLVKSWRQLWQNDSLPFLVVQLPNFGDVQPQPAESNWALLREAQATALELPRTALAVNIDLGEWNDIHPLRKKEVGERLALAAQDVVYKEPQVQASAPRFQSVEREGNRLVLTFSNEGGGLVCQGNAIPGHFALAGADKQFVWAEARLEGQRVVVWSPKVPEPVAVRYAWADNPEGANLYGQNGLPVAPFRTDSW